ncbi:hypothetical protein [Methylorubrum suomiense]|nr:hypothetical protein [Methylorubrum suomiense]
MFPELSPDSVGEKQPRSVRAHALLLSQLRTTQLIRTRAMFRRSNTVSEADMTDIDGLPAWARRRLARHFERGGNVRILRWMSVPLRRGPGAIDAVSGGVNASSDPFIAPPPRPDAATTFERPRAVVNG